MKNITVLIVVYYIMSIAIAQQSVLFENMIVQNFYSQNHSNLYWFSSSKNMSRAIEWLTFIEQDIKATEMSNQIQIDELRNALYGKTIIDSSYKVGMDMQITSIILNYMKELHAGSVNLSYDEINGLKDSIYIYQIIHVDTKVPITTIVAKLTCKDHEYLILEKYLHDSLTTNDTLKYKTIIRAMNYRKYLCVNHPLEYILVNIPEAEAYYYKNDTLTFKMRTVVGKKLKPTLEFASYITSIVTFPYWNVPHSIATKEILPKVLLDDNYLEQNNFDVVDDKGTVIDDSELNWNEYTETNFPFHFRQSTGINNSLGVLKFNLQNPYSIFLHATSWQGAFAKDYRFLSHGCIRLEKPFDLANALLRGNINLTELKKGKKNTKSTILVLPAKIATFIIYNPVIIVDANVIFLEDVYGLINK